MQLHFKTICLILLTKVSFGQTNNFKDLNNKLLCNVYTYGKADSATNAFLKVHFPYLTKKKPVEPVFTAPVGPDSKKGILSMKFKKHPFFDFNISHGQLNFKTIKNSGDPIFQTEAELYLFFTKFESADSAFTQLIQLYKRVSKEQSVSNNENEKTAKFIGDELEYYTPKAYIVLSKNGTGGYKIYFHQ